MSRRTLAKLPFRRILSVAAMVGMLIQAVPSVEAGNMVQHESTSGKLYSAASYAAVLERYVDASGRVDYHGLKSDRSGLDAFAAQVASLPAATYEAWDPESQIAFWINAYNALTMVAILDHYPIQPSRTKERAFPENSIRHIDGVWDRLEFQVMHEEFTLDRIEHEILRAQFREPRIHVALVCASVGCPPLRREPYSGEALDAQLNDQAKRFLRLPNNFRVDRDNRIVYLSSIFDWFGDDFAMTPGAADAPGFVHELPPKEKAILEFVVRHVSEEDRAFLLGEDYHVGFLPYDWALNEQKREEGS